MSTSGNRRNRRSAKKRMSSKETQTTPRQRAILFGALGVLAAAMVIAVLFAGR